MPGLDGTGRMFSSLTSHWQFDAPFLCVNYPASVPTRLDSYVEHVVHQVAALDRVVLVAESFSGPVAVLLAARLGPRLAGLVLCASFATTPHPLVALAHYCPSSLIEYAKREPLLLRHYCMGSDAAASLIEELSSTLGEVESVMLKRRLAMLVDLDVRAALKNVAAPILLLQAGRERLLSGRAVHAVMSTVPQATVAWIDGPHLLLQAKPQACWQAIGRWSAAHGFALCVVAA